MKRTLPESPIETASGIQELETYQEELASQNRQLLEMQRALERAAERYAELYQFAPVALLTLDQQACVVEMNLGAAALFEVERNRCSGYPLRTWVAEPYRRSFLEHIRQCRGGEASAVAELEFITRHKRHFRGEITTRPIVNKSRLPEFRCAIVDLTERLETEEARHRADEERRVALTREEAARASAEAKDRFIAMLSHELRTPLTPILATASELELSQEAPPELRAALTRIRRNVEMEVRLIDDLLDVSRIERRALSLELQPVNVDDVVRDVLDSFKEQVAAKRVLLRLEQRAQYRWLVADRTRLQQVIANLLRNALQFTPEGGRILVSMVNPDSQTLRVEVEDTGIGVEPARLKSIFSPFEHHVAPVRKPGGLGLGLSICRGIIEAHGGTIEASSAGPGHGTRFGFELQVMDVEQAALHSARTNEKSPPSAPSGTLGSPRKVTRVLIVEDHLDSAETLAEILERRGYRTRVASSVEAALEEAERGFELLISDIGLPDGSGHELMKKLRARGPIKAIALSGYGSEKDVADSRRAGFSEHLTKPIDVRALLKAIERACSSSAKGPS